MKRRRSLFRPGRDYLIARDGDEMQRQLSRVLHDPDLSAELAASGLQTVRARDTCRHRVDELMDILARIAPARAARPAAAAREPVQ